MTVPVVDVTPQVARLIDGSDTPSPRALALANTAVPIITAMAQSYTRGHGFDAGQPNAEIQAVIVTAAARLAGNPTQTGQSRSADDRTTDLRTWFTGWTLAEMFVLNRYRKRAA